ncbi:MAG: hypothetical protein EBQ95_00270 [Gammaproteobacteria bacterium]|nr:hypothetical protein [Gammaproteobacteria bacterium]
MFLCKKETFDHFYLPLSIPEVRKLLEFVVSYDLDDLALVSSLICKISRKMLLYEHNFGDYLIILHGVCYNV